MGYCREPHAKGVLNRQPPDDNPIVTNQLLPADPYFGNDHDVFGSYLCELDPRSVVLKIVRRARRDIRAGRSRKDGIGAAATGRIRQLMECFRSSSWNVTEGDKDYDAHHASAAIRSALAQAWSMSTYWYLAMRPTMMTFGWTSFNNAT
jgi:hypothetical protein